VLVDLVVAGVHVHDERASRSPSNCRRRSPLRLGLNRYTMRLSAMEGFQT